MMRAASQVVVAVTALLLLSCASGNRVDDGNAARRAAQTNTELGRQYIARGQYEVALDKLKRAVAHDNTYAPAHTVLAFLYENINDGQMAAKEYKLALKYDPKGGSVNNNYGAFLCSSGKWPEAEPYFLKALEDPFYDTPALALSNAGLCALNAGDLDKAEKYLRQSIEYDENLPASLLALGKLSYQRGQYLRARAFLQRYEAVASHTEESLDQAYKVEKELGDEQSAEKYRRQLLREFPNSGAAKAVNR
jgi:type IV pilus assembly protein PilF